MYTYIRIQHKGYYLETETQIDADYWAGQIGTTYQDFLDGKWVLLSPEQVAFHEEYPNASVKEVLDMHLRQLTHVAQILHIMLMVLIIGVPAEAVVGMEAKKVAALVVQAAPLSYQDILVVML